MGEEKREDSPTVRERKDKIDEMLSSVFGLVGRCDKKQEREQAEMR